MRVTGVEVVLRKLAAVRDKQIRNLITASERTSGDIAKAAKRDHEKNAHAKGRYENQSRNLTQSIMPRASVLDGNIIIGTVEAGAKEGAELDYAAHVEARYPFLHPAAVGAQESFKDRCAKAMQV
jgi:predicted secreted protein